MSAMRHFIVMGVSGSGKSSIAAALALRMGGTVIDADDLHPQANVSKMQSGQPLTDGDRWPWLSVVARTMRETPGRVFCACSALRQIYRDYLRYELGEPVLFLHLQGSRELIAGRLKGRKGHFMPPALLASQFATLEIPDASEPALNIDVSVSKETVVASIMNSIGEQ